MSETKQKKNNKLLTVIGWSTYGLAGIFIYIRNFLDRYPADNIMVCMFVAFFLVAIVAVFGVVLGWFSKKPLSYSITIGGILCPLLCLLAIGSMIFVSPSLNSYTTVVMFENDNPEKAQVVEGLTSFDYINYSATRYWLVRNTPIMDGFLIEYYYDGNAIQYHKQYHDQKDQFKLVAESLFTNIIRESTILYSGQYRTDQICYLTGVLSGSDLPDHIKFSGKLSLSSRTFISEIVGK
ncbi:MAG: hypothetical protein ACNFW9_03240 [Candidatus Kerfeldbacteria bacterium]